MKKVVPLSLLLVLAIVGVLWATWRAEQLGPPPSSDVPGGTRESPIGPAGDSAPRASSSEIPAVTRSEAGAEVAATSWQLEVFVCDTRGRPVVGAEVSIAEFADPSDYTPMMLTAESYRPVARSAGDGSCVMTVERPYCAVRARHVDGRESSNGLGGAEFAERGPVVLQMLSKVLAQGIVLGDGGQPVAGAEILRLRQAREDAEQLQIATSAEDGRFSFSAWQGWTYQLSARAGSRTSYERELTVPLDDPPALVELRLRGSIVISGTVRDEHGELASKVTVLAHAPQRSPASWQTFTMSGRFRLELPDCEPFEVEAMAHGHGSSELVRVLPSPDGEPTEIALQLRPMATITGQVVDPDGRPMPGAWVSVGVEDSALREPAPGAGGPRSRGDEAKFTAANGTFSLQVDPGASWTLTVIAAGSTGGRTVLEHVEPGTTGLHVVLGGIAATVHGSVARHDGRAVGPFDVRMEIAPEARQPFVDLPPEIRGSEFTLQTRTRSDSFRVLVVPKSPDLAPAEFGPFAAEGQTIGLAVTLQPWGELPVQVVTRDGWPAVGAKVWQRGSGSLSQTTDHRGRTTLTRCRPGEAVVEVSRAGVPASATIAQIQPGLNPELRVQLR
ncbi:MAG: carboxypeptidase regulatory-like domain-containing protein [Planctomycetes bacterium]|nr:carboxypeptidase regulatory-like domain-containing protein [Planctomycetota bacterium]